METSKPIKREGQEFVGEFESKKGKGKAKFRFRIIDKDGMPLTKWHYSRYLALIEYSMNRNERLKKEGESYE